MRTPVSRFEIIAGYFILLTLALLVILFVLPGLKHGGFLNRSLFTLNVLTDDGMDLGAGDKVMMKGLQIGEVAGLKLHDDHSVVINCTIYWKFRNKVTTDSTVFLVPAALVGRGKIEIEPGLGSAIQSGMTLPGIHRSSVSDRMDKLLGRVGRVIENINQRVGEMQATLLAFQKILDEVGQGKGSLGRLVYEDEFYVRSSQLIARFERASEVIEKLRAPLTELTELMPSATAGLRTAGSRIDDVLANLQRGMREFPVIASKAVYALSESRKVIESLKRSFLIRGNLPADPEERVLAPASRREPYPVE